jgi:non-specific serine/threonine protein kinase
VQLATDVAATKTGRAATHIAFDDGRKNNWWVSGGWRELDVGEVFADFRVEAVIGRGGMGVVYRAWQLSLDRLVALKLVAPDRETDEEFRTRFLREGRSAAALEHPHVLPVYQAGEAANRQLFLAVRYVEGEDLRQRLASGPLEPRMAVRIVVQLASALEAAHNLGLLHRDVKPGNVLLTEGDGGVHAYLTDFGLAKRVGETVLTRTGDLVGTVDYLAPENIVDGNVDARSDVYALGCLLFECLTGAPPFRRDAPAATIWAHVNAAPPRPSALRPGLPANMDAVVERALVKDPAARYRRAIDLARALRGDSTPAAIPRPAPTTSLPVPASSFVGRESEVDDVVSLLRDGARLVTLTGPGGSGKTRLAIRAAAELAPEFEAGVFWVGLATVRDPALVLPTIAQVLGAGDDAPGNIGERRMLLLLDNLEQVIEAAPDLAGLVEACPHLRLLVTSRELLRVRGEIEYQALPLADQDALELFCARAQVKSSSSVEDLCRRLDRMPLALELAAARTSVLTVEQILERLSRRLDLFKGGRDADPRQQTLRATIEWSHDLLSDDERELFGRLSVFAGGCTLDAAEQVCAADLDTLQSLVDKSLLRHSGSRFWMLETIREFGTEQLNESYGAASTRRRHAEWLVDWGGELDIRNTGQADTLRRLRDELPNIRMAFEELASGDRACDRLLLATRLAQGMFHLGFVEESKSWLAGALAQEDDCRPQLRAEALTAISMLSSLTGDPGQGARYVAQAAEIASDLDEPRVLMDVGMAAGVAHLGLLELDEAWRFTADALTQAEKIADGTAERSFEGTSATSHCSGAISMPRRPSPRLVWSMHGVRETTQFVRRCCTRSSSLL